MATYSDSVREHLKYLVMKETLAQLCASKKAVRKIKSDNFQAGRKLDREEAETIATDHFVEDSDSWIRAVGWLLGQSYAASRYYYKKELPALIEANETAAEANEGGSGIDVNEIIRKELGDDDPDLSF